MYEELKNVIAHNEMERRLNELEQRIQKLEEKMTSGIVLTPAHVDEKSLGELSATTTAEDDTPGFVVPVATKGV